MALGDKQVWVLGEPHLTNEDNVVIWSLGSPYVVIDSVAVAAGWTHKFLGVANASIGKINGVAIADIKAVNGVE